MGARGRAADRRRYSSPCRLAGGMGMGAADDLLQGNFKHGRSVAGQGPAADPAAVVSVVDTDHLVQVLVAGEGDAVTLMEGHGCRRRRNDARLIWKGSVGPGGIDWEKRTGVAGRNGLGPMPSGRWSAAGPRWDTSRLRGTAPAKGCCGYRASAASADWNGVAGRSAHRGFFRISSTLHQGGRWPRGGVSTGCVGRRPRP